MWAAEQWQTNPSIGILSFFVASLSEYHCIDLLQTLKRDSMKTYL